MKKGKFKTKSGYKVGDQIRVVGIPDVISRNGCPPSAKKLFKLSLGRTFPVVGFQGELLELEVGELVGEKPYMHSIWIEPEFVEPVKS